LLGIYPFLPLLRVVSGVLAVPSTPENNHFHVPLWNERFHPINIILQFPVKFRVRPNIKASMDNTKTETVLWAMPGRLVNKEQHRLLKLASGVVTSAVPEYVGSDGAGNVGDLVERAGEGDLLQDGRGEGGVS
jgi:hypothetical protein